MRKSRVGYSKSPELDEVAGKADSLGIEAVRREERGIQPWLTQPVESHYHRNIRESAEEGGFVDFFLDRGSDIYGSGKPLQRPNFAGDYEKMRDIEQTRR